MFKKLLTASVIICLSCASYANKESADFWASTQKGANIFNKNIRSEDIKAAKAYGITFIRLALDKWPSKHRDFLIGNADEYKGLIKEDLQKLIYILDMFHAAKMPVVITMLSLPGSRWQQHNNNKIDTRLWKEEKFQKQAALFWKYLAAALKDHPAIIGYNILNEPTVERAFCSVGEITDVKSPQVQETLYCFYAKIIESIRSVDPDTTIILDSSAFANAKTFANLKPRSDKNIVCSFHIYDPYEYTNLKQNGGKWSYPGKINGKNWDKKALRDYMGPVVEFQKKYDIPSSHIIAGEFGASRMSCGICQYFTDLIEIFKENNWHFAFYAFREDVWDGMDYELGDKKLPWTYWKAQEEGKNPAPPRNDSNPIFEVIKKALQ